MRRPGPSQLCRLTRSVSVLELCGTAGRTQGVGDTIAGALCMLASLLDVRLGLLHTAFGLEIRVVSCIAHRGLSLAGELLGFLLALSAKPIGTSLFSSREYLARQDRLGHCIPYPISGDLNMRRLSVPPATSSRGFGDITFPN